MLIRRLLVPLLLARLACAFSNQLQESFCAAEFAIQFKVCLIAIISKGAHCTW